MEERKERIAHTIKQLRTENGETQKELAKQIGVTTMAVCWYELGKRVPNDEIKIKIAHHFDKSVDEIFYA